MKRKKILLENLVGLVKSISSLCTVLFLFVSVVCYYLSKWVTDTWGLLSLDEIIFHLKVPLDGTNEDMISDAINMSLPVALVVLMLSIVVLVVMRKRVMWSWITKTVLLIGSICLLISTYRYLYHTFNVEEYIESQKTESTFIQDFYTDPRTVSMTFPEQKRNLIYIFLESMEATYVSKAEGGAFDYNCIPELTQLANENISFSNTDSLGGGYAATGSTWTMGAMFAQSTGMPLKTQDDITLRNELSDDNDSVFPSVISIGDILKDEGYKQMLMIGSDKKFAGRGNFYEQHGDYDIIDWVKAGELGWIPENYKVWWGFEDQRLFEYAKEELVQLASDDQPFNFTLLTADTHFEDGYVCPLCRDEYGNQYADVMACSSRQVNEFIAWLQQQPFYANTTVVISGDHLTMDKDYCEEIDSDYERTVYNAFINSAAYTSNIKNRKFTTMDMLPTTLASLGVQIEGSRLGLGTNLFSDRQTITEEVGYEELEAGLKSNSSFYNQLSEGTKGLEN